jgi:hypothetical protein
VSSHHGSEYRSIWPFLLLFSCCCLIIISFDLVVLSHTPLNRYLEKNLEYLCAWVDDLANEQYKFQQELKREKWRKKQLAAGAADDNDEGKVRSVCSDGGRWPFGGSGGMCICCDVLSLLSSLSL